MENRAGDRKAWIPLALLAVPLLTLGCAPSGVTIASSGVDGLSYMATGKSASDHAVSEAADQNCAALRVFAGQAICRDYTPEERRERQRESELARARLAARNPAEGKVGEPTYAGLREPSITVAQAPAAESGADGGQAPAQSGQSTDVRAQTTGTAAEPHPAPGAVAPKPAPSPVATAADPVAAKAAPAAITRDSRFYLVLASFTSPVNAKRALAAYAAVHPEIGSTTVGGATLHRVIVGPFEAAEITAARARIAKAYGIRFAWAVTTCAGDRVTGCIARPPARATAAGIASSGPAG